ncbi:plasmid replication initiation protein [Larkinella arboricola]|uniref:Plasmid replication initiation protein n=1 Tax=Larkinella arboricola TaxID=643671 RepID=A0A327WV80_LARAB|nr:replication initiation protein [Larkinella arboricola]RAJ93010.1 plasmid replication initiation protein [Larkinella arboricola]
MAKKQALDSLVQTKKEADQRYTIRLRAGKYGLLEAISKFDLHEFRLFGTMLTMIQPTDSEFSSTVINVGDVVKLFALSRGARNYDDIRTAALRLQKKFLEVYEEIEGIPYKTTVPLLDQSSEPLNARDRNHIRVKFHAKLKPYLLELKREYLTADLRNVVGIQSIYTIQMYAVLKNQYNLGNKMPKYSLVRLREILSISPEFYVKYGSFKQQIIMRAIRDINTYTDLEVKELIETKQKRQITSLTFSLEAKTVVRWQALPKPTPGQIELEFAHAEVVDEPTPRPVAVSAEEVARQALVDELFGLVERFEISRRTVDEWVQYLPENQIRLGIEHVLSEIRNGVKIKKSIASYIVAMVHSTRLSDETANRDRLKAERQAEKQRLVQQQLTFDKNAAAKATLLEQYENDRRAVLLASFRKSADLYQQYLTHLKAGQEKPGLGTTMSGIVASQLVSAMNGEHTKEAFLQALMGAGYGLVYSDVMHWFEQHFPQALSPVRDKYAAVAQSLGITIH